jgi:hypothetical protein
MPTSDRFTMGIDISTRPVCGGHLRWIAGVTEPTRIRKILCLVQSRAPPGTGLGSERSPAATTHFTLAS